MDNVVVWNGMDDVRSSTLCTVWNGMAWYGMVWHGTWYAI